MSDQIAEYKATISRLRWTIGIQGVLLTAIALVSLVGHFTERAERKRLVAEFDRELREVSQRFDQIREMIDKRSPADAPTTQAPE